MTDIANNVDGKPTEDFNALSFERKLVGMVEELRFRRNLEVESEKTLKSVMDEKYQEELAWDEQMRKHSREREDYEQQIELLKRKLEDKVCVSDEDKAKQQIMTKTYSHEIRMLKEELRMSKSEKLNLQKKIQELEGKLKLHDNFHERILSQVTEVQKMIKTVFEEGKVLAAKQKNVLENVASAKLTFNKYDLCNQHLQQCVKVIEKKSESFKRELIKSRSEAILLKQSAPTEQEKTKHVAEIEKLEDKILDLENLLLTSRKENEKTLTNFLESNKLLCKFMDKYSEIQEREKQLIKEVDSLREELRDSQKELQSAKDEIKEIVEKAAVKEKERLENQHSAEMQTENVINQRCSCSEMLTESSPNGKITSTLASFLPKAMDKNFMEEFRNGLGDLQQNALVMQSEMSVDNGVHSFSLDQLCVNSTDKKITLSQVLKRKLEIMESGEKIELISMKKRFTENITQPLMNGVEESVQNKMISYEAAVDQPLWVQAISASPLSDYGDKMLMSGAGEDQLLGKNLNADILANTSSGVENEMLISKVANKPPLCNNEVDLKRPLPVEVGLDQKYLTFERSSEKLNGDEGEN